ncbi:MAG: hypothetical protein IPK33_23525 [Gemmatimonadetes bacterium]|nr:hypothetical protein [Gemmatimonadota bacterium]
MGATRLPSLTTVRSDAVVSEAEVAAGDTAVQRGDGAAAVDGHSRRAGGERDLRLQQGGARASKRSTVRRMGPFRE